MSISLNDKILEVGTFVFLGFFWNILFILRI